jgi:hypothetical protein
MCPESVLVRIHISGSIKLSPADRMISWIFVLVQKGSNAKKKVFTPRNLKDCLPNLPLETGKAKKNHSFLSRQFCDSLNIQIRLSVVFPPPVGGDREWGDRDGCYTSMSNLNPR